MLGALPVEDACYHVGHTFAETSYDHPSVYTERSHLHIHTQRDTSIDGAHLTRPKGVLSAQIIKGAHYHIDRVITETPDYHP